MAVNFFTKEQQEQIIDAIREAESNTSGEIKVHIEKKCGNDVMQRAKEVFMMLNLQQTKLRNGVLFYLAIDDHKFAILGDTGIDVIVSNDFWNHEKEIMGSYFKKGQLTEGICKGIEMVGNQLKLHFPYKSEDTNELSDDISFGSS
jgi:uncharacterized membrane protein